MTKENPENTPLATLLSPWHNNANVIWLASTIRINRNIEKFNFPQKLDVERRKHIVNLCLTALSSAKDVNGFCLKAEEISSLEKEFIVEHFLIFEGFAEVHQGTAFFISNDGEFVTLINLRDHIQLQWTDCTGDLEKTWSKLVQIENSIASSIAFAYSQKFGFLTADPMHCGTALTASAYLHVPALIHSQKLQEALEKERNEAILVSGLQGNPDDLVGDILMFRNLYTLGVSEETILSTLRNAIMQILIAEKAARSRITAEKDPHFIDSISRALGLLKFSYQLEMPEALSAISMLKLGIELGWVKGMSVSEVNALLFECRRAHLLYMLQEPQLSEDVPAKRASFLKDKMPKITLDL